MKLIVSMALGLSAFSLLSCGSTATPGSGTGVLQGKWESSGGAAPIGGQPRVYPVSGKLTIQSNGSNIIVEVAKSGVFHEVLRPGSYVIDGGCGQPVKFSIQPGKTTQVTISCTTA